MIVGGKNKETGTYVYQIYSADDTLFATVEGSDFAATEKKAQEVHREALAPIMGGCELLDMTDEELLELLEA